MHWQDACLKSESKKAFRRTKDGRLIVINWDGDAMIQFHRGIEMRRAEPRETFGYLDWQPLDGDE